MTLINLMVNYCNAGALGNANHPFIAITPRSTLARSESIQEGPLYGSNRIKYVLTLNCINLNWTDLIIKLNAYDKMNYLK